MSDKELYNGSEKGVLYGKGTRYEDVLDYYAKSHVSYLCFPKFAFGKQCAKLSHDMQVSLFGGFLLRPDLYDDEQTALYRGELKKRAARLMMCAAQKKRHGFIRAYFQGGYTLTASAFEKLLEEVKEDGEMHTFVMEQFHKAYDVEELRARHERHAIKLLENPDMAENYKDRFMWTVLSDEEVCINRVREAAGAVVHVPEKIGKRKVVALKEEVCAALNIKSIVIPKTVRNIGNACFRDSGIESITLPEGLEELSDSVFWSCKSLRRITLPAGVRHIGDMCFFESGLESIVLQEGLEDIGKGAFFRCYNLKEIILPSSVRKIGAGAFGHTGIESITLPEGLKKISANMFVGCKSLRKITLPAGIQHIGDRCFFGSGLESIVLPEGLEDIGLGVFDSCSNLKSVTIPDTVKEIGSCVFESCDALETIFVVGDPNKVKRILKENNPYLFRNHPVKILGR